MNTTTKSTCPKAEKIFAAIHGEWGKRGCGIAELIESLSPMGRRVFLIGKLYQQVNNGGFGQWHWNGYASTDRVDDIQDTWGIVKELRAIGAPGVAGIVAEVFETGALCEDEDEGEQERLEAMLNDLDNRFYDVAGDLMAKLEESL